MINNSLSCDCTSRDPTVDYAISFYAILKGLRNTCIDVMKSAVSVISTLVHLVIPLGLTVIGTFRRALNIRTFALLW